MNYTIITCQPDHTDDLWEACQDRNIEFWSCERDGMLLSPGIGFVDRDKWLLLRRIMPGTYRLGLYRETDGQPQHCSEIVVQEMFDRLQERDKPNPMRAGNDLIGTVGPWAKMKGRLLTTPSLHKVRIGIDAHTLTLPRCFFKRAD